MLYILLRPGRIEISESREQGRKWLWKMVVESDELATRWPLIGTCGNMWQHVSLGQCLNMLLALLLSLALVKRLNLMSKETIES
jgi:hypothetical protein